MAWVLPIVVLVALLALGVHAWWQHRHPPFEPLDLSDTPRHVRILRESDEVQDAARRAADNQMEAVRKMAATEDRWRQLSKGE